MVTTLWQAVPRAHRPRVSMSWPVSTAVPSREFCGWLLDVATAVVSVCDEELSESEPFCFGPRRSSVFELGDHDLLLLHHHLDLLRATDQLAHVRGDDLPAETEPVLAPPALLRLGHV